ncbi:hypothetical protein K9U40_05820 [Xanthobacter autotrophicus]|uniref:hypothetical protein n=1 Tax=Xanthobacter TaxID=279 RepID=UPI0024AB4C67|nr:hypothetical protein [Xanthobacter autotrophicus]MDI4663846.1 hypothetical protein [Xanthobacter autotrophicus]
MKRRPPAAESSLVRLARQIAQAAEDSTTADAGGRIFDREKFVELCRDFGHEPPSEDEIAAVAAEPQPETQVRLIDRTKALWASAHHFVRHTDVVALVREAAPGAPAAAVEAAGAEIWNAAVAFEGLREEHAAPVWQVHQGDDGRWSIRLAPGSKAPSFPKELKSLRLKTEKSAKVWHKAWWEQSPTLRALVTSQLGGIDALARLVRHRPITACAGLPPAPPPDEIRAALDAIAVSLPMTGQGGRPRDHQRDEAAMVIICAWARVTGQKATEKNHDLREFLAELSSLFNAPGDKDFLGLLNSGSTSSRILALARKKLADTQK